MRTDYVLIDFENVQPDALGVLDQEHFKLLVFVGANQAEVPFELAAALQRMGPRAEYIKIAANGANALDFHIAFYIGQLAAIDVSAYFHVISKDTGFDPLIQHLRSKKIYAARAASIDAIPLVQAANSKSPEDRLEVLIGRLHQLKAAKPRALRTLASTVAARFQRQLAAPEVTALIQALQDRGLLAVTENHHVHEGRYGLGLKRHRAPGKYQRVQK